MSSNEKSRRSDNAIATEDAAARKLTYSRWRPDEKDAAVGQLTAEQRYVTQQCGTEPAFNNAFWDNHEAGLYVDIVSGEPLFSSLDKFDSGTGWPSFTKPVQPRNVQFKTDSSHGMKRTEVRSKNADSHLGHVFDDGPGPDHKRYCINSASLRFIPVDKLEAEGYGDYVALFRKGVAGQDASVKGAPGASKSSANDASSASSNALASAAVRKEVAILAGGCFWGMEDILRKIPGVTKTAVGYTGGKTPGATYLKVMTGTTGHAESVRVEFDPTKISYEELLGYFFRMHDPTTKNRQGHDVGSQYRSAIFYENEEQRKVAERVKAQVARSGKWKGDVVTEIVPAKEFTDAEEYHQKYLEKNPDGYTCHFLRD